MINTKTLAALRKVAARKNLFVAAWSPGGPTKFRFFDMPVSNDQDFFGPKSGIYTALGAKAAWTYLGVNPPPQPKRRR